jgi:hypothetical protein
MSILNIDVSQVKEPSPVPDGEYPVRILSVPEVKQSGNTGQNYISVRLEVVGEVGAQDVYDIIMLPAEGQTPESNEKRKLRLKRFCDAFGIGYEGGQIDLASAEGLDAIAILSVENDPEYGERNRVRRYRQAM